MSDVFDAMQSTLYDSTNKGYYFFSNYKDSDRYFLDPLHDGVKSYYKKSEVRHYGDSSGGVFLAVLFSYNTPVVFVQSEETLRDPDNLCTTDAARFFINSDAYLSRTTLRHIREFLAQHGFGVLTAAEIRRLPRI